MFSIVFHISLANIQLISNFQIIYLVYLLFVFTFEPMKQHIFKTRHFKISPIIGIGYWKDVYLKEKIGMEGVSHNLILPFMRIQWGYLIAEIN